jgi:predicted Zn-dependent protease
LGASEAAQHHYANALSTFQEVTHLEPRAEVGWVASSGCAAQLGRSQESVAYAKRATAVAPSSFTAWSQLARAEKAAGDKKGAARAQARANQLRGTARPMLR